MRATYMYGAGDVRVIDVPDPKIEQPTDALVRVTRACVCGSDLHPYHSMPATAEGSPMGHEFIGVVEEVGAEVTALDAGRLRDRPVRVCPTAPATSAATGCRPPAATAVSGTTRHGIDGGQAEAVRVPLADGTLVSCPVGEDTALLASLLTLSDVYGTGYHAAVTGRRAARAAPSP